MRFGVSIKDMSAGTGGKLLDKSIIENDSIGESFPVALSSARVSKGSAPANGIRRRRLVREPEFVADSGKSFLTPR